MNTAYRQKEVKSDKSIHCKLPSEALLASQWIRIYCIPRKITYTSTNSTRTYIRDFYRHSHMHWLIYDFLWQNKSYVLFTHKLLRDGLPVNSLHFYFFIHITSLERYTQIVHHTFKMYNDVYLQYIFCFHMDQLKYLWLFPSPM